MHSDSQVTEFSSFFFLKNTCLLWKLSNHLISVIYYRCAMCYGFQLVGWSSIKCHGDLHTHDVGIPNIGCMTIAIADWSHCLTLAEHCRAVFSIFLFQISWISIWKTKNISKTCHKPFPSHHYFYRWYKPSHPESFVVYHCFTHINLQNHH